MVDLDEAGLEVADWSRVKGKVVPVLNYLSTTP
jgi:hypothetical protein